MNKLQWKMAVIVLGCLTFHMSGAQETRSGLEDQTAVAITIYNENLALVRDQRRVTLPIGRHNLAIRDVSAQIRPETSLLTTLSRSDSETGALKLIEQNFDFDLLSPASLLQKYIGQAVRAVSVNPANGNQTVESAVLLATNQGVVLKFADRIETNFPGRLIFDQVPDNLRDRPTLVLKLENRDPNTQEILLSYLTSGLSWRADYVANLNDEDKLFDLNGWVTLTNQSGTSYPNALLQLVAGEVQQVQQRLPRMRSTVMMESAAVSDNFAEESLLDYHLYTLDKPTTIANQQTKQVALMNADKVPVTKRYMIDATGNFFGGGAVTSMKQPVGVYLDLKNDEASNLGIPLPGGIVRVYKNDSVGRTQFIGEHRIDHTPKDKDILLKLGNAFDVTANRVQTAFKKIVNQGAYNFSAEIGHKITIENAREEVVRVLLREQIPGDWKIIAETGAHKTISSNAVEWWIRVPAGGSIEHEYLTRVQY